MWRDGHRGTGPGAFTPDGCSVELYLRLPVGSEPDVIASVTPPFGSILELGAGVGRVTHPLVAKGFDVTAVDESAAMLALVRGATTVCSPIESLSLTDRFDVVLLSSYLIHGAEPLRLLATCVRHVKPAGVVLIQREGLDWHTHVPRSAPLGDGVARVDSSLEVAPGVRSVHVTYTFPDATWTQTFRSRPLSDEAFNGLLANAGLTLDTYLTDDHTWALTRPLSPYRPSPRPPALPTPALPAHPAPARGASRCSPLRQLTRDPHPVRRDQQAV